MHLTPRNCKQMKLRLSRVSFKAYSWVQSKTKLSMTVTACKIELSIPHRTTTIEYGLLCAHNWDSISSRFFRLFVQTLNWVHWPTGGQCWTIILLHYPWEVMPPCLPHFLVNDKMSLGTPSLTSERHQNRIGYGENSCQVWHLVMLKRSVG